MTLPDPTQEVQPTSPAAPPPPDPRARYDLDGEGGFTLDELLVRGTDDEETLADCLSEIGTNKIRALAPGESVSFDLGASGRTVVRRLEDELGPMRRADLAIDLLLVPLRDGQSWRARATAGDRVVVREGDCAEELAGLAVAAVRAGEPATAPREDQAARRARVEARRPLLGRAAECDDVSGIAGFLRGAEAAADFHATAALEGVYLGGEELDRCTLARGVDVLIWQPLRKLSARIAAAVLLAALLRVRFDAFSSEGLRLGADALEDFPEHWCNDHAWSALWLAAAAEPATLPTFGGMDTPDVPENGDATPTEELLVQLVFLAYAQGLRGCARGVLDVCGLVAHHVGGDPAAMMRLLNAVQDEAEQRSAGPDEEDEEDVPPDAAAAVAEIDVRGWLGWYREAGVDEEQIEHLRRWPPRSDGAPLEVSDVLSLLETLARAARRSAAREDLRAAVAS